MSLDFNNLFGPKPQASKLNQQPPRPLVSPLAQKPVFAPSSMAAAAPLPQPPQSYTPGPPLPGAGSGMDAGKAMKFLTALFGG